MHHKLFKSALTATALLLSANLCFAADNAAAASATKAVSEQATVQGKQSKARPAKVKTVDINNAGKAELKTLPGIGGAQADKIIAGRPYLSKADLVTDNILPGAVYEAIKGRVTVGRNKNTDAKIEKLRKAR